MRNEADRRRRPTRHLAALCACLPLVLLSATAQEAASGTKPLVTIKELMEKTITPATNTIWNAYDPPTTDEQWQALEEAAVTLLAAAYITAQGGAGPMDTEWAKQPAWQAFNQVMIGAGQDALAAIRARDHDALLVASDVLYPPCEGCHMQFNPGVVNAQ
jgi:cytochrome c556